MINPFDPNKIYSIQKQQALDPDKDINLYTGIYVGDMYIGKLSLIDVSAQGVILICQGLTFNNSMHTSLVQDIQIDNDNIVVKTLNSIYIVKEVKK